MLIKNGPAALSMCHIPVTAQRAYDRMVDGSVRRINGIIPAQGIESATLSGFLGKAHPPQPEVEYANDLEQLIDYFSSISV